MLRPIVILLLLVTPAAGAHAQTYEVWVGRPTIGDHMRRDLGELVKAQQETTRSKAQMNRDIAQARKQFLATAADPSSRAKVGETFARLLWAKDIIYATSYIQDGISEQTMTRAQGMDALTGGPLDQGIHAAAWGDFTAWVNGIRASLGATQSAPRVWLLPGDVDRFRKALLANEGLYSKYVEQRDLAEIQAPIKEKERVDETVRVAKAIEAGKAADGSARLDKEEVRKFGAPAYWLYDIGALDLDDQMRKPVRTALGETQKGGQQMLECTYGPVLMSGGEAGHQSYTYWFQKPPSNMDALLALASRVKNPSQQRGMRVFLGRGALEKCPQSLAAAGAVREAFLIASGAAEPPAKQAPAKNNPACDSLTQQLAAARASGDQRAIGTLERSLSRNQCSAN